MCDLGAVPPSVRAEYCGKNILTESSRLLASHSAGQMWPQQLQPHLQRNKQLQDILLQREEELFQLQEENQKLREFLSSSFVKDLKLKAKKLTADGRVDLNRELKRNVAYTEEQPFQNSDRLPPQQISKRVCRNITTEFSSQSPPEPTLDFWVLRMLGLKDCDTIDPSPTSTCISSPAGSLNSVVKPSLSNFSLDSWFSSSSNSSSTNGSCRTPTYQHSPAKLLQNCSVSSSPCSDFIVSGPSRLSEDSKAMIMSSGPSTAFPSPPEEPSARPGIFSSTPTRFCCSSPSRSPPDRNHNSPLAEEVLASPSASSSLEMNKQGRCVCSPGRPSGRCWIPADPPADVVFRMFLSPSCSIRTHSFPQGQAFIRNNPDGRWNFTWVPRHRP